MNPISPDVARKFCELCDDAYGCWLMHKRLFDDNDRQETTIKRFIPFANLLWTITHQYVLLQICKLHDPAKQGSSSNITINYILKFGDWGPDRGKIEGMVSRLGVFFKKIKPARHKLIAHNDREALIKSKNLSTFSEGDDVDYFSVLEKLVNEVSQKWLPQKYVFDDLPRADVEEFLHVLEKTQGLEEIRDGIKEVQDK